MELLLVPVCLWVVTSFVPMTAAFSKLPICPPPSPIKCVFPMHARCLYDPSIKQDAWFCENIFTGSLKRPRPAESLSFSPLEPKNQTELSNSHRYYLPENISKPVTQYPKKAPLALGSSSPKFSPQERLKETLDDNDSKYHSNATPAYGDMNDQYPNNRRSVPGVGYYGLKPHLTNYNLNPYSPQALSAYPPGLTYGGYVG